MLGSHPHPGGLSAKKTRQKEQQIQDDDPFKTSGCPQERPQGQGGHQPVIRPPPESPTSSPFIESI